MESSKKSGVKVEAISDRSFHLGEGPHWDDRTKLLYFVDIIEKTIHKYDPVTGALTSTTLDGRPGFIVPVEGHLDLFIVGLEREFVVLQWDSSGSPAKVVKRLGEVDQDTRNRINDGKADPRGRLYAGVPGSRKSGIAYAKPCFLLDLLLGPLEEKPRKKDKPTYVPDYPNYGQQPGSYSSIYYGTIQTINGQIIINTIQAPNGVGPINSKFGNSYK